MDTAKPPREEPIARHGEPDAGLSHLENEDGRDHAQHRAKQDDQAYPVKIGSAGLQRELFQRVDHGGGIANQRIPRNQAGKYNRDCDIQDRADDQSSDNPHGNVALRISTLLRRRRNGIEADVCEEDDAATRQHS